MENLLQQLLKHYSHLKNYCSAIAHNFHFFSFTSIKQKIIFSSILLSTFPIFITIVYIYPKEEHALRDALIQNLDSIGHKQAELIEKWIEERKADIWLIAENPNVPGVIYKSEGSENFYRLLHHLKYTRDTYRYKEIFICDRNGDLKITTSTGKVITNVSGFEFFKQAIIGTTYVSPIVPSVIPIINEYGSLEQGMPTLFITTPVIYERKIIGVVCLRIDVMEINKLMRSVRLGKTGETYLINKEGYMISESKFLSSLKDFGLVKQRTTLELKLIAPFTGNFTKGVAECLKGGSGYDANGYIDYRGKTVLGFWQWLPELEWGIIAEIDKDEWYVSVKKLHRITFSILFLLTLAVVSFAFVFGKKISEPIVYLTDVTKSISEGDFSKRVNISAKDEIGELSKFFNKMADFVEEKTHALEEYTSNLEKIIEERTKDLTQINKELEKQSHDLEKAYKELLTLDQMKDKMIRDVSHELKSPVAQVQMAIDLWTNEIKKDSLDRSKEERFEQIIHSSLQRLRKTIESILDLSVLESGRFVFKKEPIQMEEIIHQTVMGMKLLAKKKGLTLTYHSSGNLPVTIGDKNEISRVLINLIDNAIKYTESGSINIYGKCKGSYLEISVEDTGMGIGLTKEEYSKLFERFFQEHPTMYGSGVGLALCKNIVEAHKGRIWVDCEGIGKGASFKFTLPVAPSENS
jgi:signal transduction histidine kinase